METEVIMKRELWGCEISQKSKTEMFSATDLIRAGNAWRISKNMEPFHLDRWLKNDSTVMFIKALESKFGNVKISGRGRGHHTWVHPYLFIDIALAISPELKIEVYSWIYDYLMKYRNDSGDSYKYMAGAIYDRISNKSKFHDEIKRVAAEIKINCGVNDWQKATQEQLELRDNMHKNIAILCDVVDVSIAVKTGINKAMTKK